MNVKSAHTAKSSDINNDYEEEKLHLCRVYSQIKIHPFTQAAVSARCFGQDLLLVETHTNIVAQRCSMATRGAMETILGVPFYIYIANLSTKDVYLPKKMIIISETNALPKIIHARSGEHKLESKKHADREWVESSNVSPSTRRETTKAQLNRNPNNVVSKIQPPMGCQDKRDKKKQPSKVQNMEGNDWQTIVQI